MSRYRVRAGFHWVEANHQASTLSPVGPLAQSVLLGRPDDTRKLAAQRRLKEEAEREADLHGLPENLYWEWVD